jgi:hypothetical protein
MTTAHSLNGPEDLRTVNRRRPTLTVSNRPIIEPVFGTSPRKTLSIPACIDDYNHNMNGGDIANQLRVSYDLQRVERRTWRALFLFFLKTSIVNAYKLWYWGGHPKEDLEDVDPFNTHSPNHRKFREALIDSLWSYKGETGPTAPQEGSHEWERLKTRYQQCKQCAARGGTRKGKRKPLEHITNLSAPPRARFGCKQCKTPLCREGSCWEDFHRVE